MSLTIIVNNLTPVHKGSGGVVISSAPDACLTPSPGGPVPVPYVNTAKSADLVNGSTSVTFDGQPVALKDSFFAPSTGDEGGSAGGGVASHVIKGKAKFVNYSFDVTVEGRNVARLSDTMTLNGNAPNSTGTELQPLIAAVGAEAVDKMCQSFCECDKMTKQEASKFDKYPPPKQPISGRKHTANRESCVQKKLQTSDAKMEFDKLVEVSAPPPCRTRPDILLHLPTGGKMMVDLKFTRESGKIDDSGKRLRPCGMTQNRMQGLFNDKHSGGLTSIPVHLTKETCECP